MEQSVTSTPDYKFVVWERLNKTGKWCPYSSVCSQYLEQNFKKNVDAVSLESADESLKIYTVNFKEMNQTSSVTGTKCSIRRHLCNNQGTICDGFIWQWSGDHSSWYSYDIDVSNFIEEAFQKGKKCVTLKKAFRGYNYEIDFMNMVQINKQSKRKRPIRRTQDLCPYPVVKDGGDPNLLAQPTLPHTDYSHLAQEVPGTSELMHQVNAYAQNAKGTYVSSDNQMDQNLSRDVTQGSQSMHNGCTLKIPQETPTVALVNGRPWYDTRPPHTPHSLLKPVPGIDPISNSKKPIKKGKKKLKRQISNETEMMDIMKEYTSEVERESLPASEEDEDCIICCESLSSCSSYDGSASVVKLKLCPHMFHRSCLLAMYNSGPKDKCIQCPVCKKIHGVKCGIQPPGMMDFHVIPYSLPGYSDCDTIRIIYDIPPGTQGPEHPNPGRKYTSKGFPRHCYLPDNEIGRKILRLLVKAWQRRLIFTIGRSSTTGEENTVTWNEIHHKTEFGCSKRGHGYPDSNYFDNVLSELEAHGVNDDEVYLWYPA